MKPSKNSAHDHRLPPAQDEYRAGVNPELLGAYWLDTPDRDHVAADCPWCRELAASESGRGTAQAPHPRNTRR
ncbi:hypothetical protein [Streptomyces natalensis]|uniref:Uncharacterized protein n=1 Tax=Streptomyces natalensis ATCC 27448 TaxID=1240678 RepID=A0A0D7CCD8_9ACTN|nr:hypothetical protein [Streptomyces natalensis]KIZ13691.1 hypothetical protein SNA_37420 [Streptomyces natalensis ATCC 27448]